MYFRFSYFKAFGRRKKNIFFLAFPSVFLLLKVCWWLSVICGEALLPQLITQNLNHFRKNQSLHHYLDHAQILIEPSVSPCKSLNNVPVIVLVSSAPDRFEARDVIRSTWGRHQPTIFFLGIHSHRVDEQLVDNYVEAKQHRDLVVLEFQDHYQNLTLKTALMLQWSLDQCPDARFVFKTDDDVLLNPWTLKKVLDDHTDSKLFGYKRTNSTIHRDESNKWYLPRWLLHEDLIEEYLSGTGYIINGGYVRKILEAALRVPLINLEDVYFSYLVAKKTLGLPLTDEKRLSCYKPLLPSSCAYWQLASAHSLQPEEMARAWRRLETLAMQGDADSSCRAYKFMSSNIFLY